MVVLINYLHVMTILPSSILVDEIYVAPLQKDFTSWFKSKFLSKNLDHNSKGGKSVEKSDDMNSVDQYLVQTYAPFVTRRSSYLIGLPIILVRPCVKHS